MAKRREALKEEEKRALNKPNIKNLLGIFKFILPYRKIFAVGLIALVLSSVTLLSFPYLSGVLVDVATGASHPFFKTIQSVALVLMGILLLQSVFSFVRVYTFSVVTEKTLADIRKTIYKKMIWQQMSFFDSRRVGELMSRITTDVSTLHNTFNVTIAELLRQVLTLMIGIGYLLIEAPKLTGFMLLILPVLVVIAMFFGKFIRKLSRKTQDTLAQANVIVEESLQSISVVKSFTNEIFEINRYERALKESVTVAISASRYRGLFISFIIFALIGSIVGVQWYGSSLIQAGELTSGGLFAFILFTVFIGGSIGGLGDNYAQLQRAIGASERLLELMNLSGEESESVEEITIEGNIQLQNVSFSYPTRDEMEVISNISLQVEAGQKVALVGPSGSGKSTIVNLLLRFYEKTQGVITIDRKKIEEYPLSAYRTQIGLVPQEVILFGGSIRENISYGNPAASESEIEEAARKANAWDFIQGFPDRLDTLVGDRGVKLSGGQRQRIAIARAILKNPAILFLDEATSSLDAASEALVQEALEKLMEGRTTIIIAHRLSTIKKVDRIFVIKDGMVVETGSHQELANTDNGIYSNLLKLQVQ